MKAAHRRRRVPARDRRRVNALLAWLIVAANVSALATARADEGEGARVIVPPQLIDPSAASPAVNEGDQEVAVLLELTIDAEGLPRDVVVAAPAGPPFDDAALDVAAALRFTPALVDGVPTPVRIQYRVVFPPAPPPPSPPRAALRGRVIDEHTGTPLVSVVVRVVDGSGAEQSATTGDDGSFAFDSLTPGEVSVTLIGDGLTPIATSEELVADELLAVEYALATPSGGNEIGSGDDLELVVVAPRLRRDAVSTTLSAREAASAPGASGDVLRVVESMPGVARSGIGSAQLVVWGAAPEDTRVYVDGVPIPRLYHEGGVRSVVHPSFVENVTLVPGGAGAPYGRGLGGVVLVETRAPTSDGLHGSVGLDLFDAQASLAYRKTGEELSGHVAAAARYGVIDTIASFVPGDVAAYAPIPKYWDAMARAGVSSTEHGAIEVVALVSGDRFSRGVQNSDPALVALDRRELDFVRISARATRDDVDGSRLVITPWVGFDRSRRETIVGAVATLDATDTARAGVRASRRQRVTGILEIEPGIDVELSFAAHERRGSLALPSREGDRRVFGQAPLGSVGVDTFQTASLGVAPYVEARAAFFDERARITSGLRLDPSARSTSRKTPIDGNTPGIGAFANDFAIEPRLSFELDVMTTTTLRAAGGVYRQEPAAADRSAAFGNPALPAASGMQGLVGLMHALWRGASVDAVLFATSSDGLAVRSPRESPLRAAALEPVGAGRALGAQLLLRHAADEDGGAFGWIAYTLSRAERRDAVDGPWRLFDFDQTHALTAVVGYRFFFELELSSRLRASSGFPRTPVVGAVADLSRDNYTPIFGPHNSERLPPFFQLDVRVAQSVTLFGTVGSLFVEVQNATNAQNVDEIVYAPDFSREGAITGLPFLPVAGMQWSF